MGGFVIRENFLGLGGGRGEGERSLGLLDDFIEVLFGFGYRFRKLRHFVQFGRILFKSLTKQK